MKFFNKLFFATVLSAGSMLAATQANAEMTCGTAGCIGVPKQIIAFDNGNIRIYPFGTGVNITNLNGLACKGIDNNAAIEIDKSSVNRKEMYSMLLAAKSAKQSVFVRINPNVENCRVAYVRYDGSN